MSSQGSQIQEKEKKTPTSKAASSKTSKGPQSEKKFSVSQLLIQAASKKDTKDSYNGLVQIRTHVLRLEDGITLIRQRGGAQILIDVLEYGQDKVLDVCLSILGNCCTDDKFRTEVIQRDGVATIGTVLQETKSTSIQNRACRTLANIALSVDGCRKVHDEDQLLEAIVRILSATTDPGSQQTFIRIIRLLSDTKPHRVAVLRERGLKVVADLLKSSDDGVMMAALKTVSHYINEHPTEQSALQLDLAETSTFLLTNSKEGGETVAPIAKRLILVMVKQEGFRPGLGNAGSIHYFLEKLQDGTHSTDEKYVYINSLCLSCKESLNRVRIRESNGLETLLVVLQDPEFKQIHNRIISALLCFLYDEPSFQILLKNGVVELLTQHLACCISHKTKETIATEYLIDLIDRGLDTLLSDVVIDEEERSMEGSLSREPVTDDTLISDLVVFSIDSDEDVHVAADNNDAHEFQTKDRGNEEERNTEEREGADTSAYSTFADDLPRITVSNPLRLPDLLRKDEDELSQKEDSPRHNLVKYSMDSPTYKQITESNNDYSYDPQGPTNIRDCQDVPGSSPAGYSSPTWSLGSPMSIGSSSPESFSPFSCTSSFVSPDRSPRLCMSPTTMDEFCPSPLSDNSSSVNHGRLHISQSCPGQFSPLQQFGYSSPTQSPAYSMLSYSDVPSPASVSSNLDRTDVTLEYSSSEEDELASAEPTCSNINQRGDEGDEDCGDKNINERANSDDETKVTYEHRGNSDLKEDTDDHDHVHTEGITTEAEGTLHVHSKDVIATTEANILIFLSRVSFMDNPSKYLTNQVVIESLINFLICSKKSKNGNWSRAHRILLRILKLPTSLDRLMECAVPMVISIAFNGLLEETIASPTTGQAYTDCLDAMSLTAQNRYGLGVVKHSLMTGSIKSRMKAFLCVPLLYSDSKEVEALLSCIPQGLDIVTHCLATDNGTLFASAVVFLCHVTSVCLGHHSYNEWCRDWTREQEMPLPRKRKRSTSQDDDIVATSDPVNPSTSGDLDVKFIIADGSFIQACRRIMTASSSVFAAMLEGSFSESCRSVIEIPDVDRVSFCLFVDYLHTSCSKRRDFLKGTKLDSLLGVLFLAERYLVHSLHRDASVQVEIELKALPLSKVECDMNDPIVVTMMNVVQKTLLHNNYYIAERTLVLLLDAKKPLYFRHNMVKKCLFGECGQVDKIMATSLRSMLSILVKN